MTTPTAKSFWVARLWFIATVLLAAGMFFAPELTATYSTVATQTSVIRPIEEIRVGMRVASENPGESEDFSLGADVERATWRHLHLRMTKDDVQYDIELLRPTWWLEEYSVEVGQLLPLTIEELQLSGHCEVLTTKPCPPIESGRGRVVTGTFRHHAAAGEILNLFVEGEPEPIGVTRGHVVWSQSREEFVRVDELRVGEQLLARDGSYKTVMAFTSRSTGEMVYNIEVHGLHAYQVAQAGLVVHNASGGSGPPRSRADLHEDLRSNGFEFHHTTKGRYVEYRHPDGSRVWVRPNGEVVRLGPKVKPSDGGKPYRPRVDSEGNLVDSHNTGEYVSPLPSRENQ